MLTSQQSQAALPDNIDSFPKNEESFWKSQDLLADANAFW
jgi:hypothetical protein